MAPSALTSRHPMRRVVRRLRPRLPRMIVERVTTIGIQKFHQFATPGLREARAHPDVLQRPRIVKQAEQKRSHCRALASFVPSKAGHDAVAVALMLDLE